MQAHFPLSMHYLEALFEVVRAISY